MLEDRRMATQGLNLRYNTQRVVPTIQEISQHDHVERLPTWKNAKHGPQAHPNYRHGLRAVELKKVEKLVASLCDGT